MLRAHVPAAVGLAPFSTPTINLHSANVDHAVRFVCLLIAIALEEVGPVVRWGQKMSPASQPESLRKFSGEF